MVNQDHIIKYLYFLNYADHLSDLCHLEMKSLFGFIPGTKSFSSTIFIDPSRSIFIKECLAITHIEESLEKLERAVKDEQLILNGYKISYLKLDQDVTYHERLNALRVMGFAIEGQFAMQNPSVELAITKENNKWMFGYLIRNDHSWIKRKQKPFSYSYAMENTLAMTLINIAIGNNYDLIVVDPCCGIGTVIIEGRHMGINIKGFDVNQNVVWKSNRNLRYFAFVGDVTAKDIKDIQDYYDVAIVDLPYGKFSTTTLNEQKSIINETRRIAKKAIFISMVDMRSLFSSAHFIISEQCLVQKSDQFSRYITICT